MKICKHVSLVVGSIILIAKFCSTVFASDEVDTAVEESANEKVFTRIGQGERPNFVADQYENLCTECHGKCMEGARAPSLLDDIWSRGGDDDSLAESIRYGIPEKGMPAWGAILSEAQIRSLVIYIHEMRAGPGPHTAGNPNVIPSGVVESELHEFRVEIVAAKGLEKPWSFAFLPDGRMLVTEHTKHRLRIVEEGKVQPAAIKNTPHAEDSVRSVRYFAVALHPYYQRNGWIYLSYLTHNDSESSSLSSTTLIRGRIHNGIWIDSETLMTVDGSSLTGRVVFDDQGHVYMSTGGTGLKSDRTGMTLEAQDLSSSSGKIFRLNDDGRIPPDNPFIMKPGALAGIWTYGHRVPQGLAFDPYTRTLWSTEHGPRGGDELNWIVGGRNYGWPIISYGMDYVGRALILRTHQEGMEQPVVDWTPSIGVSNLTFYDGNAFLRWRHQLFVSSLKDRTLYRFALENGRPKHCEVILRGIGRMRDVAAAPDGYLYILLDQGKIVRLVPAAN